MGPGISRRKETDSNNSDYLGGSLCQYLGLPVVQSGYSEVANGMGRMG